MRLVSGIGRSLIAGAVTMAVLVTSTAVVAQSPDADLLLRVPEAYRAACAGIEPDLAAGETAGLVCNPAGGAVQAEYYQYGSTESLQAAFGVFVDQNAVDADGDSCTVGPSVIGYTIGDEQAGDLACYPNPGSLGGVMVQWTDESLGILAFGVVTSGGYPEAYDWWLGAGPQRSGVPPIDGPAILEPSADDPVASVNAALDTLITKQFDRMGDFACAEHRATIAARYDLGATLSAGLPDGVDPALLIDALTLVVTDRVVSLAGNDGQTATVSVAGSLVTTLDQAAARPFAAAVLEAMGQDSSDASVDAVLPGLVTQMEGTSDLADDLLMVLEDGRWLICEEPGAPDPTVAPTALTSGPMDPARYAELLAMVPEALRDSCRPNPYWEVTKEPGELAAAQCDPDGYDGPDYATYSLFLTADAMDAAYDVIATEYRDVGSLKGPGGGQGAGEGAWESGRRFCYTYAGLSASTYWTHDGLRVMGSASRPDLDWAALDAFWQAAGPIEP